MFGFGFGQNAADRDPSFNTFSLPLGSYFVENEVSKCAVTIDNKILIIEKGKLIRLNNNLLDTSFNAGNSGFNAYVNDFVEQSDGKLIVVGNFTKYNNVVASKIIRLNIDGTQDTTFNAGNIGFSYSTTDFGLVSQIALQTDGKILITPNGFGGSYNGISIKSLMRLNFNGTLDSSFGLDNSISDAENFCIQNDGKILVSEYNYNFKRINNNGTIDFDFNFGVANGRIVKSIAHTDGKITIVGNFTNYNNIAINGFLRLNADGTIDNTFNVGTGIYSGNSSGSLSGFSNNIIAQPDGKILLMGAFEGYNGVSRKGFARINTNGSLDLSFNVGTGFNYPVNNAYFFANNKILIVGRFTKYNEQAVNYITKLNTDGLRDLSYNNICVGFDGQIKTTALQADGKILVSGDFNSYNGITKPKIIRLNVNGNIDNTFNIDSVLALLDFYDNTHLSSINTIVVQPNGKILLGGEFYSYSTSNPIFRIIRLNSDGTIDNSFSSGTNFNAGFNNTVNKIAFLANGKILIGGNFNRYNNVGCSSLVRLNADGSLDNTFLSAHIGNSNGNDYIRDIVVQNDEKILLLGNFKSYLSSSTPNLIRLNPNGSRDTTFNVSLNLSVTAYGNIFLQQNSKIILSNVYSNPNAISGSVRLNTDGTLDSSFTTDYNVTGIQADDKMFIDGFNNGSPFNLLISNYRRINSDGTPDYTFATTPNSYANIKVLPNGRLLAYNFAETINNVIAPNFYRGVPTRNLIRLVGQDFNFVQGQNKFDSNNNGCDTNDLNFPNVKLNVNSGANNQNYIADNTGNYKVSLPNGSNTITPTFENPNYFNVSPTSITVNFPTQTSPQIQDFCITPNGTHSDLEVSLLPIDAARPGFDAKYKLVYKNKGNQLESGTINLAFNDSVLDLVSANPAVSSQSLNSFSWNFTNLHPSETREITIVLNLNTPMETPALNGGSILNYTATATSLQTDETPNNNTFTLNQTVVNSFDPNDKTCLQGLNVGTSVIGDYVHYVIRFENTGNYAAQNITIKDVIDTNKFDVSTLIPLSGSALFTTKISDINKVEFLFENINLPFLAGTNTGYVAFKIKTKSTLTTGDTFGGLANIFFDYNFPITTNTYTTTIQALSSKIFSIDESVTVYPNPTSSKVNINANNIVKSIEIYDIQGRILQTVLNANSLDLSDKTNGIYFLKITTEKGSKLEKIIRE